MVDASTLHCPTEIVWKLCISTYFKIAASQSLGESFEAFVFTMATTLNTWLGLRAKAAWHSEIILRQSCKIRLSETICSDRLPACQYPFLRCAGLNGHHDLSELVLNDTNAIPLG